MKKIKKIEIPTNKVCIKRKNGVIYRNFIIINDNVNFNTDYIIIDEDKIKNLTKTEILSLINKLKTE